jgi:branched-chain amino acid transport system permease protein
MLTLFSGLAQGGAYALAAAGLVLVYSVAGVPNLAHGEILMVGGLVAAEVSIHGVPFIPAILIGTAVATLLGTVLGAFFDYLRKNELTALLMASLGLIFVIQALSVNAFGFDPLGLRTAPGSHVTIDGARIPVTWLIIIVAAFVLIGAVMLITGHTTWGRGMRAMAVNPVAASVVGIPRRRYAMVAFVLGAVLAGIAGGLLVAAFPIDYTYGSSVAFVAFTIVIFAGIGSVGGALLGGMILGLVNAFATAYVSSSYAEVFEFLFLVVVLLLRPDGLFGVRVERD